MHSEQRPDEVWATIKGWSAFFRSSVDTIGKCLRDAPHVKVSLRNFYSESHVRERCAELLSLPSDDIVLKPTYKLDNEGMVDISGRLAVGLTAYARALERKAGGNVMNNTTMLSNLRKAKKSPVPDVRVVSFQQVVDVYLKDDVD